MQVVGTTNTTPSVSRNLIFSGDKKPEGKSEQKTHRRRQPLSNKQKIGIFATTLLGVASAMALVFKYKKMPLKTPKDFFKNLTTIKYDSKKHEVEALVGMLAVGSVGGGLLGGAIFDKKENMKAKLREAIIQLIGNIGTPLLCVSFGIRQFEKHLNERAIKAFKLSGKMTEVPKMIASAGLLIAAIFAGNKIGNVLNENLFNVKDNRKLKLADMSPHIDDACLALSLVAADSSHVVSRLIPAALMIAGVSTGTAQERPERLKAKVTQVPAT